MKYLIEYSAYEDCGNGYYVQDFEKIEENFEDLCREIVSLESNYKDDTNFRYCIYELHESDKEVVTNSQLYLNLKKELEQEQSIRALKEQINLKRNEISNIEFTKNKYGKWEKYDKQLNSMINELQILRNELNNLELKND